MKRKHERDLERDNVMMIFKITAAVIPPTIKFKIDMNAQQLHLSGVFFVADQHTCSGVPHIIIVEGGPTACKRYKKLMLQRITECEIQMVWEGSNPS
jgi:hypothetical protein